MALSEKTQCDCQSCPEPGNARNGVMKYMVIGIVALAVWYGIYSQLSRFADWFAYSLLGLDATSHFGTAVQFFVYDTPKVLLLLILVVFLVGILRSFVTVNWTRSFLAGKRESVGNVLAALLGVVTPFCSCSAVPLFIGFMTAGIPLGVTFSFLIAAPMVNEIALVLLYGLLGWEVAALYFVMGITIAVVAGWVLGRMKLEAHVEDWVKEIRAGEAASDVAMTWPGRFEYALSSVKDITGRVWKFVVLGIAAGALIHGYVPEGQLAGIMGDEAWWSVPLSVILGIPMYTNAAGIIPVVEALLGKGAALGTVLAFMMSVIALSFPEMVILRKVLKPRLIAIFIAVVGSGILAVGYLFNAIV
ncbi:permease [Pseudodesulfovibrio sp. JC047]|uniref:permease n=1 Tax=Pseudodesulfovibrio sp. JC047 TaxID=2683199 RepID=UPI0013D3A540|nr:permease [Pseudodesulfovibrio sp. JC047]NDV20305.1 permease [Pseudodesulfovibrio sp. JC047]